MIKEFYEMRKNGIKATVDEFKVLAPEEKTGDISGFSDFVLAAEMMEEMAVDHRVLGSEIEPFVDLDGFIKVKVGGVFGPTFSLTEWSLQQLSQKLSVPSAYAMKLAEAGKRDLFVANFKSWIDSHHAGKYFLIRTVGDTIRGVLSDSYQATDTHRILPLFQESLQSTNMNFNVHKGIINPEYASIRVVSDRQIDVGGDPHFVGMSMSTSDVGRASMKMEFFVYRTSCTNGMLFGKHGGTLFQRKHTNRHLTDDRLFEQEVREGLSGLNGLVDYATDMLKDADKYKLKNGEMDRIMNEYRAFARIGERETATIEETIKDFIPVYNNVDNTLWSVSNGFTEMAQLFPIEKAETMENFAGHLLHKRLHA